MCEVFVRRRNTPEGSNFRIHDVQMKILGLFSLPLITLISFHTVYRESVGQGKLGKLQGRAQVVLDFEWTADNRKPVKPISEIIQFPSVLVRLDGHKSRIVDEFNTYVRPTLNNALPRFSTELTGITQAVVDRSPALGEALFEYLLWLKSHGLVGENGERLGSWAFCTWSDADIAAQMVREFHFKKLEIPKCFDQWVDLKILYRRHYRKEASGGLQTCVERVGLRFEGRAHDGLIDSRNTAAIANGSVVCMKLMSLRLPTPHLADQENLGKNT